MKVLTGIFVFLLAAFPLRLFAQEPDQQQIFAQAHSHYSAGNLAAAKELLQKTLDPKYPLVDYSLYYLAVIALTEGNLDLSRQLLSQLQQEYPRSIWFHRAQLQRAKIDLAEKKYPAAIQKLRSLRNVKGSIEGIAEEALYLEAQAQETQGARDQAHLLYQELRALYPNSRWTALARKEVARLRRHDPDQFGLNTSEAVAEEADRLKREREYAEAETLYKKILSRSPPPTLHLRLLVSLADLYFTARKRNEAVPVLRQIAEKYPDSSEAPKALYQLGQIFWNRHENTQALDYFRRVVERHATSSYVARSQYAAADIYESLGKTNEAITLYSNIPVQFPSNQAANDALWRLGWLYYRTGDLSQAYRAFKRLAGQPADSGLRTAALYWQSRIAEKIGDTELAKELYQKVFKNGEESYYGPLAARSLARLGVIAEEPKGIVVSPSQEADPPLTSAVSFHLSRARALAEISLHQLAVGELDEIWRITGHHTRLHSLLMREYFHNRAYSRSLALANQLSGDSEGRNRYRFPLAYWETIQKKAGERNLDPYLIVALIRQESLFDARARSPAFALGLMQLLPSTATKVARQIGLAPPSNEELFEPELNLTLGTQYLRDLLQRYSNNWPKAIAAYNAGERAVDRWEKEIGTEDMEEFVERIPYLETRTYVKLVMRNHRIYQRLYNQSG